MCRVYLARGIAGELRMRVAQHPSPTPLANGEIALDVAFGKREAGIAKEGSLSVPYVERPSPGKLKGRGGYPCGPC